MNRLLLFVWLVYLGSTQTFAQDRKKVTWSIGIQPQRLFVYAHSDTLVRYKGSGGWALQVDLNRLRSDETALSYAGMRYNSGFSVQLAKFDSATLGSAMNLAYFIEPLLIDRNKLQLRLRAAGGVNFASNPFSKTENPFNRAYSLPVNGYLGFGLSAAFVINKQTTLFGNATYSHFSNGNTKNPNLGLNYPHMGLGIDYTFKETNPIIKPTLFYAQRWRFDLGAFGSNKSLPLWPNERFWVYGAYALASYRTGKINGWTLGAEFFKDNSNRMAIDSNGLVPNKDRNINLAGVMIGHEFLFNRMIFLSNWAITFSMRCLLMLQVPFTIVGELILR